MLTLPNALNGDPFNAAHLKAKLAEPHASDHLPTTAAEMIICWVHTISTGAGALRR